MDFAYDGGGMGKGGEITMAVNGDKVAGTARAHHPHPVLARREGVDIGMDVGSPIDFTYQLPFAFTGRIEKVTVELKPADEAPTTARQKAAGVE